MSGYSKERADDLIEEHEEKAGRVKHDKQKN